MPDVTLIDGPHDGETLSVNDGEWPQEILRFEDSLYRVDDVDATSPEAHVYTPAPTDDGTDPLDVAQGPPGDQGPAGETGATGPAGADGADGIAIGLTWMAEWSADATYSPYDAVSHDGSSFYTEESVTAGVEPPASPWRLIAAKGDPGDGGGGGTAGAMVWEGAWSAGSYPLGSVVRYDSALWVAIEDTTDEPAAPSGPPIADPTALSGTMDSHWLLPDTPLTVTVDGGDGSSAYWTGGGPGEYVAFDCQPSSSFSLLMEQIGGTGNVQVHVGRTAPAADGDSYSTSRNVPASGSNTYTNSEAGNDARYVFVVNGVGVIRFTLTVTSGSTEPTDLGGGAPNDWEQMLP
jgi:hypothetical protein